MIKKITLFFFFVFIVFLKVSALAHYAFNETNSSSEFLPNTPFLGQWLYIGSYDSIQNVWVSYLEQDAKIIQLYQEVNFNKLIEAGEQTPPPYFQKAKNYSDLSLCLKDTSLVLKISPITNESYIAKVNFLEFTKDINSTYTYTDRTSGYLRMQIQIKDKKQYITFFNDENSEEYLIIEFSDFDLVLLDEKTNKKHLFKRKL